MHRVIVLVFIFSVSFSLSAQKPAKEKIYDPGINVEQQIDSAVLKAAKESKHVLIQIGGNWCSWCIEFHGFIKRNDELNKLMSKEYVYILLNIDRNNKHPEIMKNLRYPQRFGYPVFVILDGKGNYLHAQNSALLEKDKSYDLKKVKSFLRNWTVKALDDSTYSN